MRHGGMALSQQSKVEQLHAITNGDLESERAILESVDWDVQRAVDIIFDSGPNVGHSSNTEPPRKIEQMEIDDSSVRPPNSSAPSISYGYLIVSRIASVLALPLTLTFSLLSYTLRLLRIPVPRPSAFSWQAFFNSIWFPSSPFTRRRHEDPGTLAERWVRELEAEVGVEAQATASERRIPEFYLGSYEDALGVAKRELRIMCVILVTEEHDDVPLFKKETLTDPTLLEIIADNNILTWGGDVRDPSPYSAALKLGATTYPFVAFIALQPVRLPGSSSSNNTLSTKTQMTVLSRHSGTQLLTPSNLTNHVINTLLPRVTPPLERLKAEERRRVQDRIDRAENERRAGESAQRDVERIYRKREEERHKQEVEAETRRLGEERQRAEDLAVRKAAARQVFWSSAAATMVPPPPSSTSASVRITLRLPTGDRQVRQFSPADPVSALYAWSASILAGSSPPPASKVDDSIYSLAADGWGFSLSTSYPRVEVPFSAIESELRSVADGALKSGGLLVLEYQNSPLPSRPNSRAQVETNSVSADDEYLSEED